MKKVIDLLLTLLGLNVQMACSQQTFDNADVKGFAELIQSANIQLLDVRTAEEFAEGHLEGALNVDINQDTFLQDAKTVLETGKPVAVYCRSGRRSAKAAEILIKEGFKVTNLEGGILAWTEEKMPVVSETQKP